MNKDFIPYEEALELKGLGFDEKCFAYYAKHLKFELEFFENAKAFWCRNSHARSFSYIFGRKENLVNCTAPLYQQAFRWFREKHDLCPHVQMYNGEFHFVINEVEHFFKYDTTSYESAELACLKKMIQVVKENLK